MNKPDIIISPHIASAIVLAALGNFDWGFKTKKIRTKEWSQGYCDGLMGREDKYSKVSSEYAEGYQLGKQGKQQLDSKSIETKEQLLPL